MTREEREDAINCFKNKLENEVYGAKYNKLAIEALEQALVLDKIKSEIKQYQSDYDVHGTEYDRTAWKSFNRCLQIIDKYGG